MMNLTGNAILFNDPIPLSLCLVNYLKSTLPGENNAVAMNKQDKTKHNFEIVVSLQIIHRYIGKLHFKCSNCILIRSLDSTASPWKNRDQLSRRRFRLARRLPAPAPCPPQKRFIQQSSWVNGGGRAMLCSSAINTTRRVPLYSPFSPSPSRCAPRPLGKPQNLCLKSLKKSSRALTSLCQLSPPGGSYIGFSGATATLQCPKPRQYNCSVP